MRIFSVGKTTSLYSHSIVIPDAKNNPQITKHTHLQDGPKKQVISIQEISNRTH